jgi:NAD(P)H-nitrite reductase large subunit
MELGHYSSAREGPNVRSQVVADIACGQCDSHHERRSRGADRIVCRCFRATESDLSQAIQDLGLKTLEEVCAHTGAGNGCTGCREQLLEFLTKATSVVDGRAPRAD